MTQYIGYDLGDGDTLVSFRRKGSEVKDAFMPGLTTSNQDGKPLSTLLSIKQDGTAVIGETVFYLPGAQDFSEIFINFKRRPSTLLEKEYCSYKERVVRFADALFLDEMFFNNTIDPNDSQLVLYLGYPTLWNEADGARYQSIFKSCGFIEEYRKKGINVTIDLAKESRAAMLNILNRAKGDETSKLYVQIENGTFFVVFDFGSSTTDVTLLKRDGDYRIIPHNYGDCNLGARLIDWGIYRLIMENLDEKVRAMHRDDEFLKCKSVFMCRGVKERYFTLPATMRVDYAWGDVLSRPKMFPIADYFDGAMVNKAATLPVPELGGLSYRDAAAQLFKRVAKSTAAEGLFPSLIILTGGASRMDFIQTLCREAFPKTKTVYLDYEPSACIARGLVYAGTIGEKVKRFEECVRQFCESPKIRKIIDEETPFLTQEIAKYIRNEAVGIMEKEIFRWRNGHISTLSIMEQEIESSVEKFLNGEECRQRLEIIMGHWFGERVIKRLDWEIKEICNKFDIVYQNDLCNYMEAIRNGLTVATIRGGKVDILPMVVGALQEVTLKTAPLFTLLLVTVLGPLLAKIIGGVVALLSALIFAVLSLDPIVGWTTIITITGFTLLVLVNEGVEAAKASFMNNVKNQNIPIIARNLITDAKIHSELNGKKSEIRDEIELGIKENEQFRSELQENIVSATNKIVQTVATQITLDLNG